MSDSEPELPHEGTPPDDQPRKDAGPESTSTGGTPAKQPSTEITPPRAAEAFRGLLSSGDDDDVQPRQIRRRSRKDSRSEMGFLEHLEELRMVIMKSAMAAVCGMAIVGAFFMKFFAVLHLPLTWALGDKAQNVKLITNSPFEIFAMIIQVSVFGGVILMSPLIAYFVIRFVAPGLTWKEKGMLRPAMIAASILFFSGALACFFLILPAGLKIAYNLNDQMDIAYMPTARNYYSIVVWSVVGTGLLFEFPLILVILQVLGVIESDTLRRSRRFAVIIILVVGGLIAPSPDVVSMLLMSTPMYVLFEASIVVGAWLRRRHLATEAERAQREAG